MKRIIIMMLAAITALFLGTRICRPPINQSEFPKAAQTFLSKYFPDNNVRKAEKEQGYRGIEYNVGLGKRCRSQFPRQW